VRLILTAPLPYQPVAVKPLPSGNFLILSKVLDEVVPRERLFKYSLFLEEYDQQLERVRSRRVFERTTRTASWVGEIGRRFAVDAAGTPWLADRSGATGYATSGEADRVDAPLTEGLEVAALTLIEDDFLFCCHRIEPFDGAPAVLRVSRGGTLRWLTSLPMERPDQTVARRPLRSKSEPLWICDIYGTEVTVSSDAALVTFVDGGGIGCCHAVSLSDGAIRFTIEPQPVVSTAASEDGQFFVAMQGYGMGPTTTGYSAHGAAICEWPSSGAFVIHDREIRMIEFTNQKFVPRRLVLLQRDGTITEGDALSRAYSISAPLLAPDGTVFFLHGGVMLKAEGVRIRERVPLGTPDDFPGPVVSSKDCLYGCFGRLMPDRTADWHIAKVSID
jgi:hypothetical protein